MIAQAKPPPNKELKKKLNKADYIFRGRTNEILVKRPGDIDGIDFCIRDCKQCDIYLHDRTAQVFVDDITESIVVIGPDKSSVFVRDCSNCRMIIIAGQLRVRDCHNIEIMLYSQTDPVIESSSGMQFWCLQYAYRELSEQMQAADLSIWNNKWSDIYDFTPS